MFGSIVRWFIGLCVAVLTFASIMTLHTLSQYSPFATLWGEGSFLSFFAKVALHASENPNELWLPTVGVLSLVLLFYAVVSCGFALGFLRMFSQKGLTRTIAFLLLLGVGFPGAVSIAVTALKFF